MELQLSNFSSIFEIFCGYNVICSSNNNHTFDFLKITSNVQLVIQNTIDETRVNLRKIAESKSANQANEDIVNSIFDNVSEHNTDINRLSKNHKKFKQQITNAYLHSGIFCFFILLFAGLQNSFLCFSNLSELCVADILLIIFAFTFHNYLNRVRIIYKCLTCAFIFSICFILDFTVCNPNFIPKKTNELILFLFLVFVAILPCIIDVTVQSILAKKINRVSGLVKLESDKIDTFISTFNAETEQDPFDN